MNLPTVQTDSLLRAKIAAKICITLTKPLALDGPPGTGKTTAALHIAHDAGLEHRVVLMPERPRPQDLLRAIGRELTGVTQTGTRVQMEQDLSAYLTKWQGLLIIDEAQNVGPDGMAELQYLYDGSGQSFHLILAGHGCHRVIDTRGAFSSRVLGRVDFTTLQPQEVPPWYAQIDDYAAQVNPDVILHLNEIYARGNLRAWDNLHSVLRSFNDDPTWWTEKNASAIPLSLGKRPNPRGAKANLTPAS